jgi:hypothetical protein
MTNTRRAAHNLTHTIVPAAVHHDMRADASDVEWAALQLARKRKQEEEEARGLSEILLAWPLGVRLCVRFCACAFR